MENPGVPPKQNDSARSGGGRPTAPSVSFFQLTEASIVPAQWKNDENFTITRLQSPIGVTNPITKVSAVRALLVSVSLRSIPQGHYHLWADAKQLPTSYVPAFRSNVIDFDARPACWADSAFDYLHYHMPREVLDDIARDWKRRPVSEYKESVMEDDLVVAQMTKSILPAITARAKPGSLILDQFQLILGAHLVQKYGGIPRIDLPSVRGLAVWQKRRALELLRQNLDGNLRLGDLAKECGLSVTHFARSFKAEFGLSSHQWLIRQRIDRAKELLSSTKLSLIDVAAQSGFGDQAAFTRTFHRIVGASPGRWRREYQGTLSDSPSTPL
jgi:AraC family transcriptional regulator